MAKIDLTYNLELGIFSGRSRTELSPYPIKFIDVAGFDSEPIKNIEASATAGGYVINIEEEDGDTLSIIMTVTDDYTKEGDLVDRCIKETLKRVRRPYLSKTGRSRRLKQMFRETLRECTWKVDRGYYPKKR